MILQLCLAVVLPVVGMAQQPSLEDREDWPLLTVHVQAIRVADDDGRRPANITPAEVREWVDFANQTYAPAKIRFAFGGGNDDFVTINDTALNEMDALSGGGDPVSKARARAVMGATDEIAARYPGKMVVFFRYGQGATPTGAGFSGGLLNCVVMPGFRNTAVGGHQNIRLFSAVVGAYLALRKTFPRVFETVAEAEEYFRTRDSNPAAFDGDGLSDTAPDPFIREVARRDPSPDKVVLNGVEFIPPCDNVKSFWDAATNTISPQQSIRARWWLAKRTENQMASPTNRGVAEPIEAEAMRVLDTRSCRAHMQSMAGWSTEHWSADAQLFCRFGPDGSITLSLPAAKPGRVRLGLYATQAPDFGRFQVLLDGRNIGEPFDAYAPRVTPTGRVSLGVVELASGKHSLRFDIVGKNQASEGFNLSIDCVELVKAP